MTAAPLPIFRTLTQSALQRGAMDITKLFHELGMIPDVEVVVALLPEVLGLANQAPRHRKCCATCFPTKPTIAGRCVCSRISSDSRCRPRWRPGSGIGKSCGKSAGRLAAPATILKESVVSRNRKGTSRPGFAGRRMGCDGGDIEPQRLGLL